MEDKAKKTKSTKVGIVVSDKMDKTVVVRVDTLVKEKMYQKYIRRTSKFKAHDDKNACKVGDKVQIMESRPLSKDKRWKVSKILESSA
jgi:small subunit ribosomal protein S17